MVNKDTVINREPCPKCRADGEDNAGDNFARYGDGHGHCFKCGHHEHASTDEEATTAKVEKQRNFLKGTYSKLPHRKLTEDTCKTLDYRVSKLRDGRVVEIACYYRDGKLVGQKVRTPDKKFKIIGSGIDLPLYGQQLWKQGGKRLIVTEGEIDALTVSQIQDNRWPVVSVPNGAQSAAKSIKQNLEWVNSFETVVFAFDMDEEGQKAAKECAELLTPGRAAIASMIEKDANDTYRHHGRKALNSALWQASVHRPDGILHISEVKESSKKQRIWPYPWTSMTNSLMGQRSGEITMLTSGTGMGKSSLIRELALDHLLKGRKVGMIMLEESVDETRHDIMSLFLNKPIRQILAARELNEQFEKLGEALVDFDIIDDLSDDEYQQAIEAVADLPLYLYDHRGSNLAEDLQARLEYMVVGLGCDVIYLDHLSVIVASMDSGGVHDIDHLMTNLRSLVERTGVHLCCVTQLRKSDGTPYEEGGRITLHDLRGSGSLSSVPNTVLALERNQQHPDKTIANTVTLRSLKGRFNGRTGVVCALQYNVETGRFEETDFQLGDNGELLFTIDEGDFNEQEQPEDTILDIPDRGQPVTEPCAVS